MRKVFMDQIEVVEPLECPKCGKRSLIQQSIHKYHCLWCHFQRDISEPDAEGALSYFVQAMAIFFTVLIVLLVADVRTPDNVSAPETALAETNQSTLPTAKQSASNLSALASTSLTLGKN